MSRALGNEGSLEGLVGLIAQTYNGMQHIQCSRTGAGCASSPSPRLLDPTSAILLGCSCVPGPMREASQLEGFQHWPRHDTMRTYVRTPTFVQPIDQLHNVLAIFPVLDRHGSVPAPSRYHVTGWPRLIIPTPPCPGPRDCGRPFMCSL